MTNSYAFGSIRTQQRLWNRLLFDYLFLNTNYILCTVYVSITLNMYNVNTLVQTVETYVSEHNPWFLDNSFSSFFLYGFLGFSFDSFGDLFIDFVFLATMLLRLVPYEQCMKCLVVRRRLYSLLGKETTKLWHISPAQFSVIQLVPQLQIGQRQPSCVRNVVCLRDEALRYYLLTHACKVRCKVN